MCVLHISCTLYSTVSYFQPFNFSSHMASVACDEKSVVIQNVTLYTMTLSFCCLQDKSPRFNPRCALMLFSLVLSYLGFVELCESLNLSFTKSGAFSIIISLKFSFKPLSFSFVLGIHQHVR